MTDRETARRRLEEERLRDELAAKDAEHKARTRIVLRPGQRIVVRLRDETRRSDSDFSTDKEKGS